MNLILTNSSIKLIGVQDDLKTIDFRDDIGYSTADLVPGYNTSDASPTFNDALAAAYPVSDKAAVYLLAYHIPYTSTEDDEADGNPLVVTRTSNIELPSQTDAQIASVTFDYAAVANTFSVACPFNGWVKLKMFAIDIDAGSQDYNYNTTSETIISLATGLAVSAADIVDELSTSEVDLLMTSALDYTIARVESKFTTIKMNGTCDDVDLWREHMATLQVGRTAAKLQFDTLGNTWNAIRIIEQLENYIIRHGLDEL
jgi:hypothetical protein